MRVIAGAAKGVPLRAPRDRDTRPITDRVKETLFGILGDRVPDARVLDLYAGSGAIGIEALSRGAASVDFVERGREALAVLRANLDRTGLADAARIHAIDVERFIGASSGPWDLVIADPPYGARAIVAPLRGIGASVAPRGIVVLKHFWRADPPTPKGMEVTRQRRFGETMLSFIEAEES